MKDSHGKSKLFFHWGEQGGGGAERGKGVLLRCLYVQLYIYTNCTMYIWWMQAIAFPAAGRKDPHSTCTGKEREKMMYVCSKVLKKRGTAHTEGSKENIGVKTKRTQDNEHIYLG